MKKATFITISLVLLLVMVSTITVFACNNQEYEITFIVDGQTYKTITVKSNEEFDMPSNPVKAGYIFDGWYIDEGAWTRPYTSDTKIEEDITVYAKWIINSSSGGDVGSVYTVTFNSNGGTEVSSIKVTIGVSFKLPTSPIKAGSLFDGWFVDNNTFEVPFTTDYVLTRNIVVYAKWKPIEVDGLFVREGTAIVGLTVPKASVDNIEIPKEIDGVTITEIADGAFKDCSQLEIIAIPYGVTKIGNEAFLRCKKLKSISIPNSVTSIGKDVFSGCTALDDASLSKKITTIPDGAF